jgi:hypothetical protein
MSVRRMAAETVQVILAATLVEVGLRFRRLPSVAEWCGVRLDLISSTAAGPPAIALPARTRWQLRVVDLVMRHWPFGDTCLRRCLVLGSRLRRLHPVLRIGVALNADGSFRAHSWLEVGGQVLDSDVSAFAAFGDAR